ncbi:MAG: phage holin family protein [Flavobacterium sp.]|nr:phage holin family protein [Candidatus Neoflavobacterium equi]
MKIVLRLVIISILVLILPNFIDGITVDSWFTSILVAVVLAFLNTFLKPVLKIVAFPITMFTLGLFLLVINAVIVLLVPHIVQGFSVDGFFPALIFSIVLSVCNTILGFIVRD